MRRVLEGEALISASAEIAKDFHEGQEHSFGEGSYFDAHLEPVASIVRRLGYGAVYISGGYLHDIKEDTEVTNNYLLGVGIPVAVVDALGLLTKKDGQAHEAYLQNILTSPIATVAKYADSSFNFSWTMLNSPDLDDEIFRDRSHEYAGNIQLLHQNLPTIEE